GQIAVVVIDATGPAHARQLVLAVHGESRAHPIVGAHVQVPGGVIEIATVLGVHRAVGPHQLPDVVVVVRVIAVVAARVPDALVTRVVKIFALVEHRVRAVVQICAGQPGDRVVCVGDVTRVGQGELDGQAGRLPY